MADQPVIVNQPPRNGDGASGAWLGVLVVVLILVFIFWGLPRLRGGGGSNINVPDKIQIETQ